MARNTSNTVTARVEGEIKRRAETVLSQHGVSMSWAIGMFLRQVAMQRNIPFNVTMPERQPIIYRNLTRNQFDEAMRDAFEDIDAGRMSTMDGVPLKPEKAKHRSRQV